MPRVIKSLRVVAPVPPRFTPSVVEAETVPLELVTRIPLGEPEMMRFVVEAVAKYPVPLTVSAVEEAYGNVEARVVEVAVM